MAELTDAETDAAAARYNAQAHRIVADLTNGCTFAFPPALAQGLEQATAAELAQVEILGAGYGLQHRLQYAPIPSRQPRRYK